MSPAILYLLIATILSTTPTTINPHHNQKEPIVAQGGNNNPSISYPERHPNQPGPGRGLGTTFGRIGMDARNPSLKQQHPIASQGSSLTPTENTTRATRR